MKSHLHHCERPGHEFCYSVRGGGAKKVGAASYSEVSSVKLGRAGCSEAVGKKHMAG